MISRSVFYYDMVSTYTTPYEAWASNADCKFYYHDDVYEKANWKLEPSQSLSDLYVERAKKIRDEYEYVILCYSGGNDSSNILETFYYNNIHIDEIVMVGSFSQDTADESFDENHNTDLYQNAFPLLKTLNLPNTKITVIDYTTLFRNINQFSLIQKYDLEWIKHIGTHKSPHNLFWNDFRKFVGPNNKKKTAWITGAEKVNVDYEKSKPYVYFNDATINSYGMNYVDENFTRLCFYCDPDPAAINIQIKQAHIFHRMISLARPAIKNHVLSGQKLDFTSVKNRLFYQPKNPLSFQSKKSKSSFISARDQFLLSNQNSDIFEYYISSLKTDPDYVKNEGGRGNYTQPYFIT
jgi:hypothetical protein